MFGSRSSVSAVPRNVSSLGVGDAPPVAEGAQQRRDRVQVGGFGEADHLCPRTLVSLIRIGTEYFAANCSGVARRRSKPQAYFLM